MKNISLAIGAGLGLITAIAASDIAEAANGYALSTLSERAGPGLEYPPIATIPAGAPVTIYGCLAYNSWCDVAWAQNRGWAPSSRLQVVYQTRRVQLPLYARQIGIPFVAFDVNVYWGAHYRNRPFYGQRFHWNNGHPGHAAVKTPGHKIVVKNPGHGASNGQKVIRPHNKAKPRVKAGQHQGAKSGNVQKKCGVKNGKKICS